MELARHTLDSDSNFMRINLALVIFILLNGVVAWGEIPNVTKNAIYKQDIPAMLAVANTSPESENAIIDAFCCDINLNDYSYEQLKSWQPISQSSVLNDIIAQAIEVKKINILNEIRTLTAEEFAAYKLAFPEREEILSQYTQNVLIPNISDLSLKELIYIDDYFSEDFHKHVVQEISGRDDEIKTVLIKNLSDYNKFEKLLAERLKYLIENNIWTCFVEGHKQLNSAYAQIGIVPDNPYSAAEQYQRLVHICFPTHKIREILQNEVDKFCYEINNARIEYHKVSGKKDFKKMAYKVPELRLNSDVSVDPLMGISEARERFIRNREDISTGTSVLGWIFGGVVGLVAKGIGDWMAIDGLVESEFDSRKRYMEDVQQRLLNSFANYSNTVISGIDNSL